MLWLDSVAGWVLWLFVVVDVSTVAGRCADVFEMSHAMSSSPDRHGTSPIFRVGSTDLQIHVPPLVPPLVPPPQRQLR